jgi:hypothetical protein
LDVDAKDKIELLLRRIASSVDASNLLTGVGSGSDKQIDVIRTQGVKDSTNAEDYVYPSCWTCCISSKLVLQHLAAIMTLDFFEKLMGVARGMNDDRLEGIVLKAISTRWCVTNINIRELLKVRQSRSEHRVRLGDNHA